MVSDRSGRSDCCCGVLHFGHLRKRRRSRSEFGIAQLARRVLRALAAFGHLSGADRAGELRKRRLSRRTQAEEVERHDGWHGIGSWALAVVIGTIIAALVGMAANRPTALTTPPTASEPSILSYEIDHLLRAPRRLPGAELAPIRAEAARILMTSSSHRGVSADDRGYLVQLVGAATGLTGADAERRVDNAIADSRKAISNARASTIILAFSLATSLLLGAVAAWAGAEAGGRYRDGMPLPAWMTHSSRFNRRRAAWERPVRP